MPEPRFALPPIEIAWKRTQEVVLDLYAVDGSPLNLAADDEVRFAIWKTDGSSETILGDTGTTNSKVTMNDLGDADTPARVTLRFHQTDTVNLTLTDQWKLELFLLDHSDSDLAKPLCWAPVVVSGRSTVSLTP